MTSEAVSTSSSDAGPSSRPKGPGMFPSAAQPEIMRAAEKDDHYASYVHEACRDAFRHLFGTRVAVACQNELKLLGQTLYYILTTGSGQQTLGEEYCDMTQVAGPYGLPPTPARRALFVIYQTTIPYLAERISSRMNARGILLDDSPFEEMHGSSSHVSGIEGDSSVSTGGYSSGTHVSVLSKFKGKLQSLWVWVIWKWPTMLPFAREMIQLAGRSNLMFFYFEGLYYHVSKRASGIRYAFIGKPSNQRPRYQILGVFLLIQLLILGVDGLRRSNISSISSTIQQASSRNRRTSTARGTPIIDEDGDLIIDSKNGKDSWALDSSAAPDASGGVSKCTLCLGNRKHPTATPCGHVFCWNCIMEWCNEKPECPLCRTPITHSSLVCIYHSDF